MHDKKLTDNDIIKTLECCIKPNCNDCLLKKRVLCVHELKENALDLISRQKAEIERLKEKDETRHKVFMTKCEELDIAKAEAVKEFADRLKEQKIHYCENEYTFDFDGVLVEDIDNLVKEMVGGEE